MKYSNVSTEEAALHMLKSGKTYTPLMLAKELKLRSGRANGIIGNIKCGVKYKEEVTNRNGRITIRMLAVEGVEKENLPLRNNLWTKVLYS